MNPFVRIDKRQTPGFIDPPELVLDSRAFLVEKGEWSRGVCDIQ
jgi:hypothetical protein